MAGRQHRERFPKRLETQATKTREQIHIDLMGPMQQASLGGSRYVLVFTDDFSCKSWTYFLKCKSETLSKFRDFKKKLEAETGHRITRLRSDRGKEYMSTDFRNFCVEHGIHQELTQACTPQQNKVSERRNRTIMERARSMTNDCQLPTYLWTEAVSYATYLINRSPTRAKHRKQSIQVPSRTYLT